MLNLDKFKQKEEKRIKEGKTTLREKKSQEKLTQIDYKSPGAFHIEPEFRELIRKQNDDEAANFEVSIKEEGVREPILYWTHTLRDKSGARVVHTVVDGHHRCEAAIKLNLDFIPSKEMKFESYNDVRIWMLRNQLGRRNIGDAEKIRIALQLTEFLSIEAKERKKKQVEAFNKGAADKTTTTPKKAEKEVVSVEQQDINAFKSDLNIGASGKINRAEEAAKIAGVSTKNVTKMKKVIEKGSNDLLSSVMDGVTSIHKAWSDIRNKEKEDKSVISKSKKVVDKELTPRQIQLLLNNKESISTISRVALAFRHPDLEFDTLNLTGLRYTHFNDFSARYIEQNQQVRQSKNIDVVQLVKLNEKEYAPAIVGYQIFSTIADLENLHSLEELSRFCHKFYVVVHDKLQEDAVLQVQKQNLTIGVLSITADKTIKSIHESHYNMVEEHQELQIMRESFTRMSK
ncbi:hypothetical protein EI427_22045 [Flammeovirga pectinis]|uniref:ParB/Sulfiredoxin domain-containing protein n=1 Tax=Flammeovirga pectinis TaxID=2494373 RepID=A0A3S9P9M7_9BACT|nr:ParB/Srx family N-terminal domain-containing protein [Flammeovirga pectinis]AZQ64911.1 hypothetical protein EI427_22045 [Flammeovirga pectinis]